MAHNAKSFVRFECNDMGVDVKFKLSNDDSLKSSNGGSTGGTLVSRN